MKGPSLRRRLARVFFRLGEKLDPKKAELAASDTKELVVEIGAQIGRTLNVLRDEVLAVMYDPTKSMGKPANSVADRSSELGYFENYLSSSKLRTLYASDLFPKIESVWMPVGALHEETQHLNQVDLLYVAAIAKTLNCKNIFEFGTYQGRTTYHLTLASDAPRVHTLNFSPEDDPSIASFLGVYFKGSDREKFVTQILSDSRNLDTTPYTQKMDYIFIDGDHSYDLVKNDTEKALAMLKPGGVMVWHDYAPKSPGVVRYIHEFSQQRPVFRIKHTCLIVYIDGLDVFAYQPPPRRASWLQVTET